jgi:signal transduction histidine kinase
MLDNLLSNAVAAVDRGGAVALTIREVDQDLEIEVLDDGPGVPPVFLPLAFDRFSRPDESRTADAGGSGLGLALVQAIARAAGGSAALINAERGLVARIRIPKM